MQINLKKIVCVIRDNMIAGPAGIIVLLLEDIRKAGEQDWQKKLRLIPVRVKN